MVRFAALVLAAAAFQAEDEALAKLKAPQLLTKAQPAWTKKKGCHLKIEITSSLLAAELRGVEKAEFEGKLIRDFMAIRGTAEIYGRGTEKLIRQDNTFVEPRKANARNNRTGTIARNPAVVVAELFRFAGGATFGADEKVGDVECRVIETAADEKSLMDQVREVTGSLKALDAYYIKDMTSVTDRKKSTSVYKAWIAKGTLLPARLEWTLTIAVNKKAIPFGGDEVPDQFEAAYIYHFTKYDTELQVDVPPVVKQKFGAP
jgi:hypothetical protein